MMNKQIRVAAVPLDIAWGDRAENIYVTGQLLRRLPHDVDIVVLPELFTTGFITDPHLMAEQADAPGREVAVEAMAELAAELNMALCFSLLYRVGGDYFNRAYFIEPSGEITFYNKRHLFAPSEESKVYTKGEAQIPVVRFRGWNVAMAVCYDVRFPVWLSNVGYKYDMLLVPANWPDARGYAWRQLLIARAIENQACVVGANRSGHDDFGIYDAQTFLFDHMGTPVGDVASDTGIVTGSFDIEAVRATRKRFPVQNHADSFTLKI